LGQRAYRSRHSLAYRRQYEFAAAALKGVVTVAAVNYNKISVEMKEQIDNVVCSHDYSNQICSLLALLAKVRAGPS
jgi:hypothetical protein